MAPAKIKTAEELARLDRIFAEVEAAERGETLEPAETRTQEQIDEDNRRAKSATELSRRDGKRLCRSSSWTESHR